ncbi:MAG: hypothetical protein A2087_03915 [Spirochaetes bacterium GWD1_61_31]|nr:MAG: hypothetical protein A2Y37_05045 [Spirochaetes bacterium GWB1_60_80]OHD32478.1 MAG: hypothetical protein A2004_12140 [Spirochaetes bacterium GWC1_61_12]OHD42721.1 MAG: hypothetical protein A2087_03915 [Spirochaetes bacterium GWD1_61_31]OHD43740.1 MAG: hypothetical protein A2Y35_00235 [Spirochaetes bacterium GWE1_60_18]OHD60226.1 MAG: hypothetical protein A2Y32_07285 [Spirochaetes bacterium GWF1_60_12]HAW87217.1 hypothetical protein [Spirochaetaceae bacterium]
MNQKLGACCGLDCAECPAHQVYLKDDPALRQKTAADWSKKFHANFDPEQFFCAGCTVKEGPHTGYCELCPVQKCALAKPVANCGLCPEYRSCSTIGDFLAMAKELKPMLDAIAAGAAPAS